MRVGEDNGGEGRTRGWFPGEKVREGKSRSRGLGGEDVRVGSGGNAVVVGKL